MLFDRDPSQTWYHVIATTYGAWLPGDDRGFRTWHHRVHVDGDYKNPPPPGKYRETLERSRTLIKHPPVQLSAMDRPIVGNALRERLQDLNVFVLCLAVAQQHTHLLARIPNRKAREYVGHAKRHAYWVMRDNGWREKLWAKRPKAIPVRDHKHFQNVYRYILRHEEEGAWVWKWEDDL